MRLGVDPAELHTAAGRIGEAGDLAAVAYQSLGNCSPHGWCDVEPLRASINVALENLQRAATLAQRHAALLSDQLIAAANGYHDADRPRPR
jgi:hypothetical protein